MKDLDLGPASRQLLDRYERLIHTPGNRRKPGEESDLFKDMVDILRGWMDDSWCWVDAAPARICGGPHFKVKYQAPDGKTDEVVEQVNHIGEMYPGVPYIVKRT
jgi:hypothetical protein